MSIHTIIVLLVLYCAVRALLRRKPTDPMQGRLVPRGAYQQQAPARTQPATAAAPFAPRYPKMSNLMWYAPPGTVNPETGEWL
jgi:hypothetical protein